MKTYAAYDASGLSPYNFGSQGALWWAMLGLIAIEATVFTCLIASYFYLKMEHTAWPPAGVQNPDLLLPTINSLILFASSAPIYWADRGIKRGDQRALNIGLWTGIAMGLAFLVLKVVEYADKDHRWDSHPYGSIVWAIIGFHSAHVLTLVLKTIVIGILAWWGYFNEKRHLGVDVQGLYWHFVVLVWLPLYATIYLSPRFL